jgi:hypothetical protein
MPSVGFEPTLSAGERPKNYALDRAATGTGLEEQYLMKLLSLNKSTNWKKNTG